MHRFNHWFSSLTGLFIILLLFSCTTPEENEKGMNSELNEWFDTQYEELLQMSPLQLTALGRKDRYDQIDDMSEAAEDAKLEWYEKSVTELKDRFNYDDLHPEDKTSYDLWVYQYERMKEGSQFRHLSYVFSQMRGMHTALPNYLINFHKVDSLEDMEAYLQRIEESGRAIRQLMERAKNQTDLDIRPPRFSYEIVIPQCQALVSGYPFDTSDAGAPLWNDMKGKIESLSEEEKIDESKAEELKTAAEQALKDHFKPVYDELIAYFQEQLPMAEEKPTGISRHKGGAEFYEYMLKVSTTTSYSADEIHNIGLQEVERIREEMLAIKETVNFEGDLQAFFNFINTDEQFFYPNTDEGRQGYLDDSKAFLDEMTKKLPDYFGILPKADLVVRRVEPFREQDGAPQHYSSGTPDGSRPGTYYAHLSDMKAMPKSTMEGVAYHEGNPGHHMQISIAQELETVPQFRTQSSYTSYIEGWALYTEALAKEMGGYQNPYYDFGRLVNEIWRAIRLVVDTGLHSKDWTEEDAIQYFKENSSIAPGAIRAEVRRYMVVPGQATSYKMGMLKIQELRKEAEEALGDDFDIKGFHDTVLGGGAMPLDLLERRVRQWIDSEQKAS